MTETTTQTPSYLELEDVWSALYCNRRLRTVRRAITRWSRINGLASSIWSINNDRTGWTVTCGDTLLARARTCAELAEAMWRLMEQHPAHAAAQAAGEALLNEYLAAQREAKAAQAE